MPVVDPQTVEQPASLERTREVLARDPVLGALGDERLARFLTYLEAVSVPAGTPLVREGDLAGDMYFVLEGRALLQRRPVRLTELAPGGHFGELGLVTGRARAASIVAVTPLKLARLTSARFSRMAEDEPALALAFLRVVVSALGQELTEMTDSVGLLLRERSLPRRTVVQARIGDEVRTVKTGTPLRELFPASIDGRPVVAALVDRKAVALNTPVSSDVTVAPLTTAHWEGRRIVRRSVGLVLLEAARRLDPRLELRLGPSVGFGQVIEVADAAHRDLPAVAAALTVEMQRLTAEDLPVEVEWWTVEEASSHLDEQGWQMARKLLKTWRDAAVPMVSCGETYAPSLGPLVPSTGLLSHFHVVPRAESLHVYFTEEERRAGEAIRAAEEARRARGGAPLGGGASPMDRDHEHWLKALEINSVGAFNDLCITGQVSQLIRVSEGFHEKHIGQIADEIARRGREIRVITIAGPSSSGKTTFIKRLTVQLQVNGINPVGISLDNYYVDREKTVRDEHGEYDFEALEALDLALLQDHMGRLVAGETVQTARYNFHDGRSLPDGGPRITLREGDVLMLEGIHGLNPRLLGSIGAGRQSFRVFVHPTTALPFDRLWRVPVSDLRLLRRIVRDRHQRGYSAADNIMRWPSVRAGERQHIFPFRPQADAIFDSSLIYEIAVLKVFADRYLLEVPHDHPAFTTADRLRQLIDRFVTIFPDHVPSTSILREFIGGSAFEA